MKRTFAHKIILSSLILFPLLLAVQGSVWAAIPFDGTGHIVGTQAARFWTIASADLDGDGDLDLITGSDSHAGYELIAWQNDGTPFQDGWSQQNIGDLSTVYGIAVGDLDNDGDLDIVSGQDSAPRLLAWQNDGTPFDGGWTSQSLGSPPTRVESVALGDLDNDDDLDVVTGTGLDEWVASTNYRVIAWQNDGTPFSDTWNANTVYTVTYSVHSVALGDLDNDGWLDIVAGVNHAPALGTANDPAPPETWHPNYELRAYQNDGTPFDTAWPQTNVGRDPEWATFASNHYHGYWGATIFAVTIVDLDDDGFLDIASAEHIEADYQIKVWQNDGTPFDGLPAEEHWTWRPTAVWIQAPWMNSSVYDITSGDFNHDGYIDLATASGEYYETVIWENDGHPFGTVISDTTWIRNNLGQSTSEGALSITAGDLDGDTYLDLAHGSGDFWSTGGDHNVLAWRNRSGGTHVVIEDLPTSSGTQVITATLGTGASLTVYSNSHDDLDTFRENVAVAWSLENISGNVIASDLTPAGDNRSATFTAQRIGAARILADHATLTDDTTGYITVTLEIAITPGTVTVGDGGAVITATLVNPNLTPVADGTAVTLTTDLGSFSGQSTITRTTLGGIVSANLTSTEPGVATITVTGDTSQGWVNTIFVPGEPYTVTLQANPASLVADGSSTSDITATVVDQYANPVADGTVVTLTTSLGSFSGQTTITRTTVDGLVSASLTAGTDLGTAHITAAAGSASDSASVELLPGEPYTVTLQANPASLLADGVSTSAITVTVADQRVHPVADGTVVTLTTSLGSFSGQTTITRTTVDGLVSASLTAGTDLGTAHITAAAGSASDSTSVELLPGEPHTVTLQANPASLLADGVSTSAITVTVTDQWVHPVADGTVVTLTTSLGSFSGQTTITRTTVDGLVSASLTAGTDLGTAHITAAAGSASDSASVELLPGEPHTVTLQANPASLLADGVSTSAITVTVADQWAHPVADGTVVTLTTSLGSFSGQTTITRTTLGGLATATWTAAAETGTSIITAAAGSALDTVEITLASGGPATVTLTIASPQISVQEILSISARVTDDHGHPVADGTAVTFTTSLDLGSGGFAPEVAYTVGGIATASLTSTRTGSGTLVATTADGISDTTTITFTPGALSAFELGGFPTTIAAGEPFSGIVVTAYDVYGNVKTDYSGSIYFTSTDPQAVLPFTAGSTYQFSPDDAGQHLFAESLELRTTGVQRISITDGALTRTGDDITVTHGDLAQFTLAAPTSGVAGQAFTLTLTVRDAFGNVITDFASDVALTTTNGGTISPTTAYGTEFLAGTWTGSVTLSTAGEDRTIVVSFGGLSEQITIDLAQAQEDLPYRIFLPAILNNG
ncbi:MAG: invasin domain 3-containing protein [Chloroflexota bacterium]